MKLTSTLAILGSLCLGTHALAAKVPLYDDFNKPGIDRSKWRQTESWRFVDDKGRLLMGRYLPGATNTDTGTTGESFFLSVADPTQAAALKATITVTAIKASDSCAANASISSASARIIGSYFNVRAGGPLPNDRTGDVGAQVRLIRSSNSTDAPGVLKVQGVPFVCNNADCSSSSAYGSSADLGTVALGVAVTAQVNWDKKGNKFQFIRDNLTPIDVAYTDPDSTPPVVLFNEVSLRNVAANCQSGPVVETGIEARFDNVGIAP